MKEEIWSRLSKASGEVDALRSRTQVPLKFVEAAAEQTIKNKTPKADARSRMRRV